MRLIQSLIAALALSLTGVAHAVRPVPDFGVMLDEDGDIVFAFSLDADPGVVRQKMRANLDDLLDTPVNTLVFHVACGSDVMHYPTQVGSQWGWRKTSKEQTEPWSRYMPPMRAAAAAGLDSVAIAGEWAKEHGLLFVPSYRINDAHYTGDPMNNPLTGRFWVEHGKQYELGESPLPQVPNYQHLLDFSHQAVRDYRLGVMLEVVERYATVMDGFQIDFTRHPYLFPAGEAEAKAPLLTAMIAKLRAAMDDAGRAHGKDLALIVRVPPTIRNCHWAGIEIERWITERLVDVVLPAASMTLNHDAPLEEFVALAEPIGAVVGGAVYPRTQYFWPMSIEPMPDDFKGPATRRPTAAHIRGAVNNIIALGGRTIQFYNFNVPLHADKETVRAVAAPTVGDRIYAITPAYYNDYTDTYENRKQIPALIGGIEPTRLDLVVGESSDTLAGHAVALRLGFHDLGPDADVAMTIALNGHTLHAGPLSPRLLPVTGQPGRRGASTHPPSAQAYLQLPVDPALLRRGHNDLTLALDADDPRALVQVVEVQLAVFDSSSDRN